jgi:hypothetical protein
LGAADEIGGGDLRARSEASPPILSDGDPGYTSLLVVDVPRRKPWLEALRVSFVVGLTFGVLFGFICWADHAHLTSARRLMDAARVAMNSAAIAWWISYPGFYWISVRRTRAS